MQRTVAITREGWYYLGMMGFVIAGAMIRDINLLYIMAGMMLGPLVYSFFASTRSIKKLKTQRHFPALVGVGEPLHVEVLASKSSGSCRALAVLIADEIKHSAKATQIHPQTAELFFSEIAPDKTVANSYIVRMHRRGKYELGPIRASTAMPIGLVRATLTNPVRESVLVSPQIGVLQPSWKKQLNLNSDGGQRSVRRRGKAEGDFYGMREWRDGDSRNWIHWRTSAKRNKLTVRQFEQRTNQDLVVVLDLVRTHDQPEASADKLEEAVSFAATLVVEQCRQTSSQLAVAAAGENGFLLQGTTTPAFRREVMERLATIEPSKIDTLPEVLRDTLSRISSNTRVVLVTAHDRDLQNGEQFESLRQQSVSRVSVEQILAVNVSSKGTSEIFQLGETAFGETGPGVPGTIGRDEVTEQADSSDDSAGTQQVAS